MYGGKSVRIKGWVKGNEDLRAGKGRVMKKLRGRGPRIEI